MQKIIHAAFYIFFCYAFLSQPVWAQDSEKKQADISLPSTQTPLPLKQIQSFSEIFSRIKSQYVEEISDEELLTYAVNGMLSGLDPHSSYLKGEKLESINESTTGEFSGLGIEVIMEDGLLKVIAPIDDTPAAQAGILAGDVIIKIDGKTIPSDSSLKNASERLRGKVGTSVTLTIVREGENKPLDVIVERAIIRIKTVKEKNLDKDIAYLKITQFQTKTAELFRQSLAKIKQEKNVKGIILDLRNNPGGLLQAAIAVADLFIDDGVIVSTKGKNPSSEKIYYASPNDAFRHKPIIILINSGSASASEIVAGALQDHNRAIILGTQSFGKGSVQTILNINDEEAIKLTTARYYTPNGISIQAEGIMPDVIVEQRANDKSHAVSRFTYSEKDLHDHLENTEQTEQKTAIDESVLQEMQNDYQLSQAYNLLKGLILSEPLLKKTKEQKE